MNHKTNFALVGILFLSLFVNAQTPAPRELPAKRTTQAIKIDGLINDAAWKEAPLMTNLVEFRPKMGAVEANDVRTEAYLLYDDLGIYFDALISFDSVGFLITASSGPAVLYASYK